MTQTTPSAEQPSAGQFSVSPRVTQQPSGDQVVVGLVRVGEAWQRGQVWINGERFAALVVGELDQAPAGVRVHDVGQSYLLPGAVDAHVHSLSHQGEGIAAATAAAAAGGVTTIVEMPFDNTAAPTGGAINTAERVAIKQDLAAREAVIDIALLGTLAPEGGWRRTQELVDAGVVGFKVSLFLTDPIRFPRINDRELLNVMAAIGESGSTLCTHAENNEVIKGLIAEREPERSTDPLVHLETRPPVSETLGVLTALEIAADKGNALHLCHLSLPRSIDLVSWYQSQGVDVTMEVCPHYLAFSDADMVQQRGRLKINPPLRTEHARQGLWDRLAGGAVGVITSDHAPWPTSMKDHDVILDNHSGVPGVETLVSVSLGNALRRDPSLNLFNRVADALTIGPARRYGIDARKGSIEPGKDADLLVFTPGEQAIDQRRLHSNAGWSPYHGIAPGGAVTLTMSRGRIIFTESAGLTAHAGDGQLVSRGGAR